MSETPEFLPKTSLSLGSKNRVLVLGDFPGFNDTPATGYRARGYNKMLGNILPCLECEWVFQCVIPHRLKDNGARPTKAQLDKARQYVRKLIVYYRPKAIVCLGKDALNATLGDEAPRTMKEVSDSFVDLEFTKDDLDPLMFQDLEGQKDYQEANQWHTRVYSVDHPAKFNLIDHNHQALVVKYQELFGRVESYVLNSGFREIVPFKLIETVQEAREIIKSLGKIISFDVETGVHDKFLDRNTIWKDNAVLLSLSVSHKLPSGKYQHFVFIGNALKDEETIRRLFTNRVAVGWNIKYDAQAIWRFCNVDIFRHVSDFHDAMLQFYLVDQNRLQNSLKAVAPQYISGCLPGWDEDVQQLVMRANLLIKQRRKAVRDEISFLGAKRRMLEELEVLEKEYQELSSLEVVFAEQKKQLKSVQQKIVRRKEKLGEETFSSLVRQQKALKEYLDKLPPEGSADYRDIQLTKLASYNAEDTYRTLQLHLDILPRLPEIENNPDAVYDEWCYQNMKRIIRMVCYVERDGVEISEESVLEFEQELQQEESKAKDELKTLPCVKTSLEFAAKSFNRNLNEAELEGLCSPKNHKFVTELAKTLGVYHLGNPTATTVTFGKKQFPQIIEFLRKKGNTEGQRAFELLMQLRSNLDLRSKFINNWRKYWVRGKFHPSYILIKNQNLGYVRASNEEGGAQSGRTSLTAPNLQQVQKLKHLRRHFKAPKGWVCVEMDYKSLEPMLVAFVTNCESLIDLFIKQLDIYQVMANQLRNLGVDMTQDPAEIRRQLKEKVKEDVRTLFKVGFLAWVYGRGLKRFAEDLGLTEEEAQAFYEWARQTYSEIYEWKEDVKETVLEGRLVRTVLGRQRSFPVPPPRWGDEEYQKQRRKEIAKAIRVGVNFCIQSVGNDITLAQAARISEWIRSEGLQDHIRIFNLVHDSIWFYIREDSMHLVSKLKAMMEDLQHFPVTITVPLTVDVSVGYDLAESMDKEISAQRKRELLEAA